MPAFPSRAVIFDMDGTLFDSEPIHMQAWIAVLNELGIKFDAHDYEAWIGISDQRLAAYLVTHRGVGLPADALLALKEARFQRANPRSLNAFPGVRRCLDRLHGAGVPMALCTSSVPVNTALSLEWTGLDRYFPLRITFNDVAATKPDPEPYRRAAELLGLPPEECLAVEDSTAGLLSAAGAGCRVIAAGRGASAEALKRAWQICPTAPAAVELATQIMLGECPAEAESK